MKLLFVAAILLVTGCTNKHTENAFQMDYPVDAARLSLSGDIHVNIDSSNGIFSRHINKRLSNICYKKTNKFDVVYRFELAKGVKQDMIATHYPRVPPASNSNKPGDRNS